MSITLVTGLWNIKRDQLNQGWSRSFDHYLQKLEELVPQIPIMMANKDKAIIPSSVLIPKSPIRKIFPEKDRHNPYTSFKSLKPTITLLLQPQIFKAHTASISS
jgi:hypothetical protein